LSLHRHAVARRAELRHRLRLAPRRLRRAAEGDQDGEEGRAALRAAVVPRLAVTDRTLPAAGLRLHVVDHGGRGRPVMLLHGGSAHAHWWDFVVPHLGPKLRAFALHLRGHGDSEWSPHGAYRVADYAGDVGSLIESLGLERPTLVGHSLGAFVALR